MFDIRKDLKNYTLMIVDDEFENIKPLVQILETKFKEVFTAENGEIGVEVYKKHKPDLIMTDIRMPVMDGLDMSEEIKKIDPTVPIVVASAFSDTDFLMKSIELGICQYVVKPLELKKIYQVFEHCIKNKFLENELELKNRELLKNNKKLTEYINAIELSSIMCRTNKERNITGVNQAFTDYLGYTEEDLIGKKCSEIRNIESDAEEEMIFQDIEKQGFFKALSEDIRKDGEAVFSNLTVIPILDDNEEVEEYLGIRQDITEIVNSIYYDSLTNYPNRVALSRDIARSENNVLGFFNIDSFKEINDFYGNETGDFILKTVIEFIGNDIEKKNLGRVYKLSGDEFAVLYSDMEEEKALNMLKQIQKNLEGRTFDHGDYQIELSFTVGASVQKEDIIVKADMALKYAKENKKPFAVYRDISDIRKKYEENIYWTKKLKNALETGAIVPHFQPIVDAKSKEHRKYECLVRMVDGDEVISPFYFLKVAYKTKMSKELTRQMIEKSFEYFKDNGHEFSINLAFSDLIDDETTEYLCKKIDEYQIGNKLIVELLESEEVEIYEKLESFVKTVKAKGARVAIDDFGSGYSNFTHLINLDIDIIKIDGEIVRRIDVDDSSYKIVQTIVNFAKDLGVEVVAEFVSSEAIYDKLAVLDIDFIQGYYTGKPAPSINPQ